MLIIKSYNSLCFYIHSVLYEKFNDNFLYFFYNYIYYKLIKKSFLFMKKNYKIIIIFVTILCSCNQVFKNRYNLNKAYTLYEKGKNEDDDKALLEITGTYNDIINQKIYAQDRLAAVYRLLGERSLAKAQYGYSAKYFSEALKILPNSPYLRYGLGISYSYLVESADTENKKKDFIERAENNINFAISKDASNPNYYAALASLKGIRQNYYKEALELINKAIKLSPNNEDYLFVLARLQYNVGNKDGAVEVYRKISNLTESTAVRQRALDNINQIAGMGN